VLYFLTIPNGPWGVVLVAQLLFSVAFCFALFSYLRLGVWVTPTSIAEQGFFTRIRFQKSELGAMVFVNTFHGGWVDTVPQLFVCDRVGNQLLRMRGQFWSRESMLTVASILEIPLTEIDRDVSTAELHEQYPGLLYWFERRPMLARLVFAIALLVGAGALYLVLYALGATSSGA
jgi:hypothetical protein